MTVDLLLHAVESGAVDFDELIPECERRRQYYTDWARHSLARFDTDDDAERDGLAVGWIWVASTDTCENVRPVWITACEKRWPPELSARSPRLLLRL